MKEFGSGVVDWAKGLTGKKEASGAENTLAPENKKTDNMFSITNSAGESISLYNANSENPVSTELLSQHDGQFSSIPAIKDSGCNFLATLAYTQLLTGSALSSAQIMSIWNEAVLDTSIMDSEGYVVSQDKLSDIALKKLGRSDIALSFGSKPQNSNATSVGYRITVPYGESGKHFVTGDSNKNIIYNPGNTTRKNIGSDEVYVYAKN